MKVKYILLILSLFLGLATANAQERKGNFDLEKFRKERAAYFTKELSLTDAEVKAFIPVLDEYMSKKFAITRETRRLYKSLQEKTTKTDEDYKKIIKTHIDAKVKEAELQKEYYKIISATLPIQKVFEYHRVEMDFMKQVLDKRNRRK